jgi:hypothetical protein
MRQRCPATATQRPVEREVPGDGGRNPAVRGARSGREHGLNGASRSAVVPRPCWCHATELLCIRHLPAEGSERFATPARGAGVASSRSAHRRRCDTSHPRTAGVAPLPVLHGALRASLVLRGRVRAAAPEVLLSSTGLRVRWSCGAAGKVRGREAPAMQILDPYRVMQDWSRPSMPSAIRRQRRIGPPRSRGRQDHALRASPVSLAM